MTVAVLGDLNDVVVAGFGDSGGDFDVDEPNFSLFLRIGGSVEVLEMVALEMEMDLVMVVLVGGGGTGVG